MIFTRFVESHCRWSSSVRRSHGYQQHRRVLTYRSVCFAIVCATISLNLGAGDRQKGHTTKNLLIQEHCAIQVWMSLCQSQDSRNQLLSSRRMVDGIEHCIESIQALPHSLWNSWPISMWSFTRSFWSGSSCCRREELVTTYSKSTLYWFTIFECLIYANCFLFIESLLSLHKSDAPCIDRCCYPAY